MPRRTLAAVPPPAPAPQPTAARLWTAHDVADYLGDPALAKITVGEWVQRWHAQQVQLKPSTSVRYDVAIRCQILPDWEHVALSASSTRTCRPGCKR